MQKKKVNMSITTSVNLCAPQKYIYTAVTCRKKSWPFWSFFFGEMVNAIDSMARLHLPISFFSFFLVLSILYYLFLEFKSIDIGFHWLEWVLLIRTITRNKWNSFALYFDHVRRVFAKQNLWLAPYTDCLTIFFYFFFSSVVQPQVQSEQVTMYIYISVKQWGR